MKKKILFTFLSIISVVLIFMILWVTLPSFTLAKKINVDSFYSNWISYIKADTKITEMVMPGSHDAGTNSMLPQARTQGHDIDDQLKSGVRYFDLRVTDNGDNLVIFHGPIKGQKFSRVLRNINDFIKNSPNEFVILDFQHLGNKHEPIIKMIHEILPMERCLSSSKFPNVSEVSLSTLRENNKSFMVVWSSKNDNEIKEAEENEFYTRDNSLMSQYNGDKHKESNGALINEFSNYYAHYDSSKLFVLQAQRTPKTLLGRPSIYELSFNKHVNKYIKSLATNKELLTKTNIIMRDFIASDIEKVNLIIGLNLSKEIVNEEQLEQFKEFVLA